MAMPHDLVGRYIEYQIDPGGGSGAADLGKVLTNKTSRAMANIYNVGLVKAAQPLWTFTFLKYVPGAVTVAPLSGNVMTGPMTGCYVFKYTQAGQYLAHVGTVNTATDRGTLAAKEAWKTLAAGPTVVSVTGSSPFDTFSPAEFQSEMIEGRVPHCVGYYSGGRAYAMLLTQVPATVLPPEKRSLKVLRVGAVKDMPMMPWAALQNTITFK